MAMSAFISYWKLEIHKINGSKVPGIAISDYDQQSHPNLVELKSDIWMTVCARVVVT